MQMANFLFVYRHLASARRHLEAARKKTNSRFDHELIDRRLAQCV